MSFSDRLQNGFRRPIPRAAIDVYDDYPIAGKILAVAFLDSRDYRCDCFNIVVRGNADKQIHFPYAHQLAQKIVR